MFSVGDDSFVNAILIDPFSTTSLKHLRTGNNTFSGVLNPNLRFEGISGIPFFLA